MVIFLVLWHHGNISYVLASQSFKRQLSFTNILQEVVVFFKVIYQVEGEREKERD